jgi:hypothetical protein
MNTPGIETSLKGGSGREGAGGATAYEVGVAIMPLATVLDDDHDSSATTGGVPGFDETLGRGGTKSGLRPALIQKGEEAVRSATEAMAEHIGMIAQQITVALEAQTDTQANPGVFGLDSVQVSFGITLSAGLQTIFTTQVGSSAQVAITLSRQPGRT